MGLAAGSVIAWWLPAAALDWQPEAALAQPWRLVTAAWVHWSPLHLGANLAAAVVVAALGCAARLPAAAALAWALAWPLTHAGLWAQPALARYGGASGVLHAAVAVAACWLVATRRGPARGVGGAIAAGLAAKVLLEQPWRGPLAHAAGWDIAVAPWAHASGALAGVAGALMVAGLSGWMSRPGWRGQSRDG
ncbi:MAG: rhombosortase [Rubrivivax sp.]|nr:rhombosortase [Rubrivivax sp.]